MVTVEREPDNKFDPYALKIQFDGEKVGYVARNQAAVLVKRLLKDSFKG